MITRLNPAAVKDSSIVKSKLDTALVNELNGKQEALTLTVKDNGNIVLANIQGQSKEFMPATPSGDPMHWAYVAAGAEYNDTEISIIKDAPWADMIDDDSTNIGLNYGYRYKKVLHKPGCWYLNGVGDLTNDDIRNTFLKSYRIDISTSTSTNYPNRVADMLFYTDRNIRTNFKLNRYKDNSTINSEVKYYTIKRSFQVSYNFDVIYITDLPTIKLCTESNTSPFYKSGVKHILGVVSLYTNVNILNLFAEVSNLITVRVFGLNRDCNISTASHLSMKSILYMINNEAATSPITITLHADAYARAMADAEILTALQNHTNVSLASA